MHASMPSLHKRTRPLTEETSPMRLALYKSANLPTTPNEEDGKPNHEYTKCIFQARMTKYLSSVVRYSCIEFQRKQRTHNFRQVLILDAPIEDRGSTYGDYVAQPDDRNQQAIVNDPWEFLQSIENELLFKAFQTLTARQQLILTFSYASDAKDREIARILRITPQAVQKSRKSALKKLKKYMVTNIDKEV